MPLLLAALLLPSRPGLGQPAEAVPEAPPPKPPNAYTLNEAVGYALAHNPILSAADGEIDQFEAKLFQAWTAYVPRFKLKSLFTVMPAARGDAFSGYVDFDDWGPFLRIEVEGGMPLYASGKLSALRDLARAGVDVAKAKRQVAVEEIIYQTKRAYYGYQFGTAVSKVIDEGKDYLEKARRRLERMEAEDDPEYDQIDMLKVRVYEGDVRARELEVDKGLFVAQEGIKVAMGLHGDAPIIMAETELEPIAVEILPLERYVALAEQNRPEIQAVGAGLRAAEYNVDLKFASFFPSIGIVANYTFAWSPVADDQLSPFSIDPFNTNGVAAALGIEWQLDIAQKIGEYNEAKGGYAKAWGEVSLARSKLLLEVKQTWKEVKRQAELIDIQRRAEKAARGWLIAKSDLYDTGFAPLQDVVDALLEFYKRKLGHIEAIYNFDLAVTELSRKVGVDVTTLTREKVPGEPE